MGFSRQHRIAAQRDFREILDKGERRYTELFDLALLARPADTARMGVVTRKKLGNAVVRNRIRRRMREIFRLFLPRYSKGFDMIVFPKPAVATCDFRALRSLYESTLVAAGLLRVEDPVAVP